MEFTEKEVEGKDKGGKGSPNDAYSEMELMQGWVFPKPKRSPKRKPQPPEPSSSSTTKWKWTLKPEEQAKNTDATDADASKAGFPREFL